MWESPAQVLPTPVKLSTRTDLVSTIISKSNLPLPTLFNLNTMTWRMGPG